MGYYTDYELCVSDVGSYDPEELNKAVQEMNSYLRDWSTGTDTEGRTYMVWSDYQDKWYSHEEDMVALSVRFPEILFELSGVGDSSEDMWRCFFKGGKLQRAPAEIIYPDFDESKLRTLEELDQ